jgi:hypothetical protein
MKVNGEVILVMLLFISIPFIHSCNYGNVDAIKANAEKTFADAGFTISGYEGYQLGDIPCPGGKVWYMLVRDNTLYNAMLCKWGTEYHIYSLTAKNAIRGD